MTAGHKFSGRKYKLPRPTIEGWGKPNNHIETISWILMAIFFICNSGEEILFYG
jgi:hypothetical protein